MKQQDIKEINLIEFAESIQDKSCEMYFEKEKAEGYILKYVKKQEDKLETSLKNKYPYFRFRGKPIDRETAFDIICRTDEKYLLVNELKSGQNIDLQNNWTRQTGLGGFHPFGWCHPDGTIGYNWNTSKYPDCPELLNEVINIKLDFPFLEFMVAFSYWNCEGPYEGEREYEIRELYGDDVAEEYSYKEDYPDFAENIELLIYTHDKVVEIYWAEEATVMYQKLLPKLQNKPDIKYVNHYYEVFWFEEEEIEQKIKEDNIEIDLTIVRDKYGRAYTNEFKKIYDEYLIKVEDIENYRTKIGLSNKAR